MIFLNILPYENYTITTKLSEAEVYKRIAENLEPEKMVRFPLFSSAFKPYEGKIINNTFKIKRIIRYRNSWLPIIEGKTSTFLEHTYIQIKMRLHTFTKIFLLIWLCINLIICINILSEGLKLFNDFSETQLMPFIILIALTLTSIIAFKIESNKSKKFLATLLEAEENSSPN